MSTPVLDTQIDPTQVERETSLSAIRALTKQHFAGRKVAIYEAGGGSISYLGAEDLDVSKITVVDIDPVQIAANDYADEKIVGDLETLEFPANSFDLIIVYNVLEHVRDVPAALERIMGSLAPKGLLVIGSPVPISLNGLVARFTPHWFHVMVCKYILGWPDAGKPGCAPFPVEYHPFVAPEKVESFGRQRNFERRYFTTYRSSLLGNLINKRPFIGNTLFRVCKLLNVFFRGRDITQGDYHLVLEKVA
jgi:SAM-dependent methyltransferase